MSKTVTTSKRHTSHTFHLIMSLITFGLWIPVWIWMTCQNVIIPEKTVTRTTGPTEISVMHGVPAPIPSTPADAAPWWTDARTVGRIALIVVAALVVLIVMAV
jgi:hypothetical protein